MNASFHVALAVVALAAASVAAPALATDRPAVRGTGEVRLAAPMGVTEVGPTIDVPGRVHKPAVFYVLGRAAAAPQGLIGQYEVPVRLGPVAMTEFSARSARCRSCSRFPGS